MKKIIISVIIVVLLAVGVYYFNKSSNSVIVNNEQSSVTAPVKDVVKEEPVKTPVSKAETVIGKSVGGIDIKAYHYGSGSKEILLVGGIHGGYEWNTSLLAYQVMDYLKTNTNIIPADLKVTVVPVLNPDGLKKVVGTADIFSASDVSTSNDVVVSGRFNLNSVDLNRNFDCDWKSTGMWQNRTVSGGKNAFSESESLAIKNYIEKNKPVGVVVWYSAAGGVYSSSCGNGISSITSKLNSSYANASGYQSYSEFDSYATTGDMANWLAKINIPAISVLLTNHTDTEYTKNLAGVKAVLTYFAK